MFLYIYWRLIRLNGGNCSPRRVNGNEMQITASKSQTRFAVPLTVRT